MLPRKKDEIERVAKANRWEGSIPVWESILGAQKSRDVLRWFCRWLCCFVFSSHFQCISRYTFRNFLSIFESCFHCHITQPWRQAWQSHESQSYHVMQMMTFAGLAQTVWQCKECSILSDVGHRSEAVWKMAAWLRSYCATVLHLG